MRSCDDIFYEIQHTLHGVRAGPHEMDRLQPPGPLILQGNFSGNWRKWRQRFELYSAASGLGAKEYKIQAATLLHVIGKEAMEIYNGTKVRR